MGSIQTWQKGSAGRATDLISGKNAGKRIAILHPKRLNLPLLRQDKGEKFAIFTNAIMGNTGTWHMIAKFCRWYLDTTSQPTERKIFSRRFRYYLWSRDFGRCQYCGREVKPNSGWHIEHILPYSAAKNWYYINHESNLVVACIPCNMKKGTKLILPRGYYQLPPKFRRNVLKMMFRSNEMKLKTLITIILLTGLFWLIVAFVLAVIL